MHDAVTGAQMAKMKVKALGFAFAFGFGLRVISQYAVGVLWDWHIFTWIYILGYFQNHAIDIENWGWYIEWTPAFIGAGMLVGLNVSLSFFGGSVLAWGIIGPILVHNKLAFGKKAAPADPEWQNYITFGSLSKTSANKLTPSPRYWMLWPGVLCMIVVSFTGTCNAHSHWNAKLRQF